MVDFSKIKLGLSERKTYLYRCAECGTEINYTIELPEHLATHGGDWVAVPGGAKRCRGRLTLVLTIVDESHSVKGADE